MSTLKVGTIQDHANSNNALVIDSSGRVTEPAKPCFAVITDRAVTGDFTSTVAVPFDVIEFQRGGTVVAISGSGDNTVATFTAPITGIYQFNYTVNLNATGNSNTFNSTLLYIDGAQISSSNDRSYRQLDDPETANYHALSSSFLISLNANQTVKPMLQANGDTSITVRTGCRFSGFLVA